MWGCSPPCDCLLHMHPATKCQQELIPPDWSGCATLVVSKISQHSHLMSQLPQCQLPGGQAAGAYGVHTEFLQHQHSVLSPAPIKIWYPHAVTHSTMLLSCTLTLTNSVHVLLRLCDSISHGEFLLTPLDAVMAPGTSALMLSWLLPACPHSSPFQWKRFFSLQKAFVPCISQTIWPPN